MYEYGEERYAPQIAAAIERVRSDRPIETTLELVDIIKSAMPERALREKQHPAKRSFQAIRIAVNDELGAVSRMMRASIDHLNPGGRLVVIHEIMPGIISGALMAFTMSLDDFVISYFVTGSSFITLPVEIYNYTLKPIQPKIYALFTLMFVVILVLMVVMNLLQARSEKRVQHGVQRRAH